MNDALTSAIDELRSGGARNVPEPSVIENSPNGSQWQRQKRNGNNWYLVKHRDDSYNVQI